jgi:uncharacterized protein YndB with AHSA1/START domain
VIVSVTAAPATIARPAERVFAAVADVRSHAEWSPKPYRTEGLPEGATVVQGTRYTSFGWLPNDKDHRNDVEVTELQAPTRLVLTATDSGETFVNTFTVTPTSTGARIERVTDMPKPGGIVGLIFPVLLRALIQPDMTKGLTTLKTTLEAS